MKLSCNVTQDLLPLYHDGVCSEESRTLVAEHLEECETCKKIMEDLNAAPAPEAHVDDAAALQALKKQWARSLAKSFAKGLAIAALVFTVLWGAWYGLTQCRDFPVPADMLEISQVSMLSTGQLVFKMDTTDDRRISQTQMYYDHGPDGVSVYITPVRSIFEKKQSEAEKARNMHIFDLEMWSSTPAFAAIQTEIIAIYVGPKDNATLLWKEGMELPAASQEMEDYFGRFAPTYYY